MHPILKGEKPAERVTPILHQGPCLILCVRVLYALMKAKGTLSSLNFLLGEGHCVIITGEAKFYLSSQSFQLDLRIRLMCQINRERHINLFKFYVTQEPS